MILDQGRRGWIRRFILGTVASVSLPKWSGVLWAEIDEAMPGEAVLKLKVGDYPSLLGVGGSIQLRFSNYTKPFTLNRVSTAEFVTLDSICTHSGCTVGPYIAAQRCMRCPCHGSRFDVRGRVFRNAFGSSEPAGSDLARFTTVYDAAADLISITIPGLALGIRATEAKFEPVTGGVRVKLRFPATGGATYEVGYQAALDGPFRMVGFTTTAGGTEILTSITPTTDGEITAYIDATGPRGFYVVGLQLRPA